MIGLKGNQWVSRNLEKKGYKLIQTLPIASKKEAIIQTQNEYSDQKPAYATWGVSLKQGILLCTIIPVMHRSGANIE